MKKLLISILILYSGWAYAQPSLNKFNTSQQNQIKAYVSYVVAISSKKTADSVRSELTKQMAIIKTDYINKLAIIRDSFVRGTLGLDTRYLDTITIRGVPVLTIKSVPK